MSKRTKQAPATAEPAVHGAARDPDAIITEAEWADWRRCSIRTVQRERVDGGGAPYVKLTRQRIGYRVGDCLAWISARRFRSTSDAATGGRPGRRTAAGRAA